MNMERGSCASKIVRGMKYHVVRKLAGSSWERKVFAIAADENNFWKYPRHNSHVLNLYLEEVDRLFTSFQLLSKQMKFPGIDPV